MEKADYVAKISGATPVGLVIINFELILEYTEGAIQAHSAGDDALFEANILKSRDFLMLLMKSLDFKHTISRELLKTYIYINSLFIKAHFSKDTAPLAEADNLLNTMLNDWRELAKTENAEPVMENAQQLYAGLTYENGKLTEYAPEDENRGFKA